MGSQRKPRDEHRDAPPGPTGGAGATHVPPASAASNFRFPDGFLWGASTSSHQVEGDNVHNDWWAWERAGRTAEPSGPACDHFRRYREDFDLAHALGHNAHRFSIEWSRIEPEEGRWSDEAIAHYREALRLLPTSAEAHNNLGNALFQLGRPQEAIPHYQESLRIKPGVAGVHSNLGIALGLLGNVPEAVPHFQEAVRLTPTSAEAHNNLGHALALQGRLAEAVVHYEEAVRLNPDNQTARDNLRRCQEALQQPAPPTP